MYDPEFIEKMKQKLVEQKTKLEADLSGMTEFPEYDTQSQDDVAEKIEADAVSQDEVVALRAQLEKVEAALARIEAGTYGKSAHGEGYIDEARLEAMPTAEDSLQDAE